MWSIGKFNDIKKLIKKKKKKKKDADAPKFFVLSPTLTSQCSQPAHSAVLWPLLTVDMPERSDNPIAALAKHRQTF